MQVLCSILSFLLSLQMSLCSYLTEIEIPEDVYAPKQEEIRLNVAAISDTHIDTRLPLGKYLLERAFTDMSGSLVPNDVVIVAGDLTNYGDEDSVVDFFEILTKNSTAPHHIITMGNHDIGHTSDLGLTNQQARDNFIANHNKYLGTSFEKPYYSYIIKGYKFIVLCDESEDRWDTFEFSDEQIAWLDAELAEGTAEGLPVFVVCHEPFEGINGQPTVWEDGTMDEEDGAMVKATLEQYENVFYLSGHMHEGINGEITETLLGFCCVETLEGVTYISLPTYLLVNRYGIPWNGLGFQMEVYDGQVVFRARSYMTSRWYSYYEFTIDLV